MQTSQPEPPEAGAIPRSGGASRFLDVLYVLAGILLIPYFLYRKLIRRKVSAGFSAKMGHVTQRSPNKRRVWIHAVSVGEAEAAAPLVRALREAEPTLDIVVSTTTVTGQEVARKRFGAENVCYYPHDFSSAVKRFLDRVHPNVIVLMELEVWPNLTAEAVARGIPIIVANARITERSARRYRRFWFLVGGAFLRVRRWLAQTEEYAKRLRDLGVDSKHIEICGNIKYDAIKTRVPPAHERETKRAAVGIPRDALVLIGGSTHPTEEGELIRAYLRLRESRESNLRLILVPRHPERADAVFAECQALDIHVIRFTQIRDRGIEACTALMDAGQRNGWVLLVDTVGELGNMYAISDLAFVGGSLIPHGGQNVMEPCGMGIPVVHGPHMHNFNEAMDLLRGCHGSMEVTRETLFTTLDSLVKNRASANAMAERARNEFLKQQGAVNTTVERITALLATAK